MRFVISGTFGVELAMAAFERKVRFLRAAGLASPVEEWERTVARSKALHERARAAREKAAELQESMRRRRALPDG